MNFPSVTINGTTATLMPHVRKYYEAAENPTAAAETENTANANGKDRIEIRTPRPLGAEIKEMIAKSMAHYQKVNEENKSHADPMAYIRDKYENSRSAYYRSDMTEKERSIAFRNEKMMLEHGFCDSSPQDYIFRNTDKNYFSMDAREKQFNRDNMNADINAIFAGAGIQIPEGKLFKFLVDPYTKRISVDGLDDQSLAEQIENVLNHGENGARLFGHIWSSLTSDTTQLTPEEKLKYTLYNSIMKYTGHDVSKLDNQNGVLVTPEGRDIVSIYMENAPVPDQYKGHVAASLREQIAKMLEIGWDHIDDLVLEIDCKDGFLYDIGQKYGYGPGQPKQGLEE
jgi:hypothetical protein